MKTKYYLITIRGTTSRIIAFPGNNPSCTIYTDEDLRGIIADSRGFWSIEEMKGESATRISRKQTLKILVALSPFISSIDQKPRESAIIPLKSSSV